MYKYMSFFRKIRNFGTFFRSLEKRRPGVKHVRRQVCMRRQRTEAGTVSTSSRAGSPLRRTTVLPPVFDAGVL